MPTAELYKCLKDVWYPSKYSLTNHQHFLDDHIIFTYNKLDSRIPDASLSN